MTHWYDRHRQGLSASDRFADSIVQNIGSMRSIELHTVVFAACFAGAFLGYWSFTNMLLGLTTAVSLEAIYLCLFMQNSLNRSGERDRHQALSDYHTNLETKQEVDEFEKAFERIDKQLTAICIALSTAPADEPQEAR